MGYVAERALFRGKARHVQSQIKCYNVKSLNRLVRLLVNTCMFYRVLPGQWNEIAEGLENSDQSAKQQHK